MGTPVFRQPEEPIQANYIFNALIKSILILLECRSLLNIDIIQMYI